jgi:hypothetical protein
MSFCKAVLSAFVFATLIAVGSASAVCSNGTLKGSYGSLEFGDKLPSYGVTLTHFVADGNGNVSGMVTNSSNGTISTATFTGTYSVARNCTGSYTVTLSNSQTANGNFVIDNARKGFEMIRTDSGYAKAGFASAQGTTPCGLTGQKATYGLNVAGSGNGVGAVAAVGQVTLDGKGTLSGNETFSLNGTIYKRLSVKGRYTVKSNCTGTAQISVSGFPTSNYNLVVVNGSKGVFAIETDANTIVTGTLTQ